MIKIIADTTSTLSLEEAHLLGVPYLPQIVVFGEKTYRDDIEIDDETFLKKLRASPALPKTAAPPPAMYNDIFQIYAAEGATMIVLTPSAELSGTYRSAVVAAQDFPSADIRIIDTHSVGSGLGNIVRSACRWVNQGLSADDIVASVKALCLKEKIYFYVDTLEYLHKGGRIGGAQALLGSVMQVKPILTLRNGRAEQFDKQRTKRRALARLQEVVISECPASADCMLSIMQSDALTDSRDLAESFKSQLGIQAISIVSLPPAIIVHAGPGTIAVSFFTK